MQPSLLRTCLRNLISIKVWFGIAAIVLLVKGFIMGPIWGTVIISLIGAREVAKYRYAKWGKDSS